MEKILTYILIGIIIILYVGIIVVNIVTFFSLDKEQKEKILKDYLKEFIKLAKDEFGEEIAKNIEEFEQYFKKNAPFFYKMLVLLVGKEKFVEIIDDILSNID